MMSHVALSTLPPFKEGDLVEVAAGPDDVSVSWDLPVTPARFMWWFRCVKHLDCRHVVGARVYPVGGSGSWEIFQVDRIRPLNG